MRFLPIIFATICLARFVSAGIYGTSPIASTVWSAGSSEFVTWMDDKSVPRLADMGNINVELFGGDDVRAT
ncbi:hypothetical protein PHLCEN_2v12640 [Hermanssonia centrifuga]|uniref:Uncharacterized protein n=1 Tax=Hermanssonia centrifuga TaxID=98765 RepID=A0A2R6NGG7_9APHY|nr:hypothetical protein PHLCEN_2v12640 [Hermanssonia centrifuga]